MDENNIIEPSENKTPEEKNKPFFVRFRGLIIFLAILVAAFSGFLIYGIVTGTVASSLGFFGALLLAVVVLLIMITVHEFGHYTAGKALGFGITEFSIGFGPAIYKKQKKNGEVFSVRALPLGGFCAFEGEDEDSASPTAFNNIKPWRRVIVLVAGAFMNFLLALVLIVLLFGIYGQSKLTAFETVPDDSRLYLDRSLEDGDVLLKLNGKTLYLQTDVIAAIDGKAAGDEIAAEIIRGGKRMEVKIILRSDVNCKNVSDIAPASRALGIATLAVIDRATSDSPFKPGDAIFRTRVGDYAAYDGDELSSRYLSEKRLRDAADLYEYLSSFSAGEQVGLWIYRGEQYFPLTFTMKEGLAEAGEDGVCEFLGITVSYQDRWSTETVRLGFFETIGGTFAYAFRIAGTIFRLLGELITGALGLRTVGGTVTTIVMTGRVIMAGGLQYLLEISAYIGVNLAVFNLLPIPALDGSRVVFTLIEMIFKKPVPKKIEGVIHTVGLLLLLGFAVLVDLLQIL